MIRKRNVDESLKVEDMIRSSNQIDSSSLLILLLLFYHRIPVPPLHHVCPSIFPSLLFPSPSSSSSSSSCPSHPPFLSLPFPYSFLSLPLSLPLPFTPSSASHLSSQYTTSMGSLDCLHRTAVSKRSRHPYTWCPAGERGEEREK